IQFAQAVHVTSIDIYETCRGGTVLKVKCYQAESVLYMDLWTSETTDVISYARIFSPPLTGTCFSNQIRLETHGIGDWSNIDAVMLHGNA
ncbi:hypothetical protein MAR_003611, partial [Mya arenaria]